MSESCQCLVGCMHPSISMDCAPTPLLLSVTSALGTLFAGACDLHIKDISAQQACIVLAIHSCTEACGLHLGNS